MTNSPHKHTPYIPSSAAAAPTQGSPRRLRKLQSAHQLSSNYTSSNAPSLISQQRQQQQRHTNAPSNNGVPPVPNLPHPQRSSRPRSNSDVPSPRLPPQPSKQRIPVTRKREDPKDELKSLMRRGPKGDVINALQDLRHLILVDGLDADADGMVSKDPRL